MADVGEDEEYESDPEQAKLSLKMRRRREASDDEEEVDDDDDVRVRERVRVIDSRVSDYESDDQGAAAEYDDEEYDLAEEEEELLEEVDDEELVEGRRRSEVQGVREDLDGVIEGSSVGVKRENDQTDGDGFYAPESVDQFDDNANGTAAEGEGGQEEKKENEPFQVPTAGAFYMHDDRFRDSSGGRHRRTLGGRKLWELRDDRKWGHDKFEEMTMQERHYDEGRRVPRGRNRAPRGRNRGEDRNFVPGNRPKTYNNNNNNQTNAPRPVRGRGPRKYQPTTQNNFESSSQNRQPAKTNEKTAHANSGRASTATSASESTQLPARKNVLASNLNSASPPFYPSGNKETNLNQKKDSQTGSVNNRENYPISQSKRNVSDSLNMDKLYIDDSGPSFINPTQRTEGRGPGGGPAPFGQVAYQPVPPHHNQVNRVSSPNQVHSIRPPALNQIHPNFQLPGQQFGQRSASGSRASSPPKESPEIETSTESNDTKTALVGKGKGSIQTGMTSFPYHGDQNFPGAPTFLPVMQFAGQHPGGLGVPAVGMAFPGYVAQPNGMGNSEMTWLPVLAGAAGALGGAGALGATYCSPYITMDGAYHARPSGQTSALPPTSKDIGANKPGSDVKPSQRPELANDELRQRQTKARRYTEMNTLSSHLLYSPIILRYVFETPAHAASS
ncbi:hypothetical protein L2E82_02509 [Cichorium intybus]|uniref:Uncharacterized protein n=1 Tax=Cichorium intybus TaxID=13427 RepID=A0ACB9H308_CICIN|nr:hypothetical protein L2E82_02509 [Cichorium intybus]